MSRSGAAGEIGGGLEGRPRHSRIFLIASGEWISTKISCGLHNVRIPKRPTQKLFSSIQPTRNSVDGIGVAFEYSRDDQAISPHHSHSDERNWWLRAERNDEESQARHHPPRHSDGLPQDLTGGTLLQQTPPDLRSGETSIVLDPLERIHRITAHIPCAASREYIFRTRSRLADAAA